MWIKVGGDKGGGSFKMSFQICNISTPNAPENTFVFAIYEGHDSATNLRICLDQYKEQITDMSRSTWRWDTSALVCPHIFYVHIQTTYNV